MSRMKRNFIIWTVIVVAVLIQFIPYTHPGNPAVQENIPVTPDAEIIFHKACYDCHSNETAWPWYGKVAPISWMLSLHVAEGRDHVNMSEWNTYSPEMQIALIREIDKEIQKGKMPLKFYVLGHQDDRLSWVDKEAIGEWAVQAEDALKSKSGNDSE